MDRHQILRECVQNLALLTQLGLSMAVPPLLCLYAADWIRNQLNLGLWIMVLALLAGIAGGVISVWKIWKMIEGRGEQRGKKSARRR